MGSKSKDKGKRFEREVADELTKVLGIGKFIRTPHSGAFTGGSNSHRREELSDGVNKSFIGDIIAPDGIDFIVECKNYAELPGGFHGIMAGNNRILNGWLQEVIFDASGNKHPHALFFKITGTSKIFTAVPSYHFKIPSWNLPLAIPYMRYFLDLEGNLYEYYIFDWSWIASSREASSLFVSVINKNCIEEL